MYITYISLLPLLQKIILYITATEAEQVLITNQVSIAKDLGLPACALPNSNSTEICCAIPLRDAHNLYKPIAFIAENNSLCCSCRSRIGINYELGQRVSRVNLKALNFNSIQHNNYTTLYLASTTILLRKLCFIK